MNTIYKFLTLACMALFFLPTINAQSSYDLKAVGDCSQKSEGLFYIDLYIKASSNATVFDLRGQNYRFTYSSYAVNHPTIVSEGAVSGYASSAAGASFFGVHTLTGSKGNLVSYNIEFVGGSGYRLSSTSWTHIGRIRFDIANASLPVNFNWLEVGDVPAGTVALDEQSLRATQGGEVVNMCSLAGKGGPVLGFGFKLSENPAEISSILSFKSEKETDAKVAVYTLLGQRVFNTRMHVSPGRNELEFELSGWQNGIYIIHIQMGETSETIRLLKQ